MTHELRIDGQDYRLTTDHAASSYGRPVLVAADGQVFGSDDTCRLLVDGGSDEAVAELGRAGFPFDDAR